MTGGFAVLLMGAALTASAQTFYAHSLTNTPDGANPLQLVWANGLFYGSTAGGGSSGNGTLFTYNTNGQVYTTIYNFTGNTNNGSSPNNILVAGNQIYGTTITGGTNGVGMIYSVGTNGQNFTPLYSFGPPPDGAYPKGGLILNGVTLYGSTTTGGTGGNTGGGTLFKITTNGTGYTTLHSFTNSPDGFQPQAEMVLNGNMLYGTTAFGGTNSRGTIFSITTNGLNYANLHSFTNPPDPNYPYGGLVLNSGVLYGTASIGGGNTNGAIFAINTDGTGFRTVYSFTGFTGNTDGTTPKSTLTFANGYLYGTAISGGAGGGGTVFVVGTNGNNFNVLATLTNNAATGSDPLFGVVRMGNALWGSAYISGLYGYGTIYSIPMPDVTSQPLSQSVTNGNSATFTVTAFDDSTISYQWYFNTNTLLVGKTTNTLTMVNVTNNNQGAYTVVLSDSFGSVTSAPAILTVGASLPTITQQPQPITVTNGATATFTNVASGSAPLYYLWFFNTNTFVSGGANPILTISPATTNQQGYYSVIVSNSVGTVTSTPALLSVTVPALLPTITQQPQNYSVTNGYNATFTNQVSGAGPFFFQWYYNTNTAVAGGTNNILQITFATTNQAGYYSVIITNSSGGAVTSSPALLTVISTKPIIIVQPQPTTVTNGGSATLSVVAAGQSTLRYQWYTNNVISAFLQAGKTNSTITIPVASVSSIGNYLVVITNTLGKATSSPAFLTVLTKPVMTLQPSNTIVTNGNPAAFYAAATGAGVLSFQWYFKTNLLVAAATNTSLMFTNAITNLVGYYSVKVTNTFGSVTSSYALLTVSNYPNMLSFTFDQAAGSASFIFAETPKSTNRLWASSNLTSSAYWYPIATNIMATNGLWYYTDTNSAKTNSIRFYRFSHP